VHLVLFIIIPTIRVGKNKSNIALETLPELSAIGMCVSDVGHSAVHHVADKVAKHLDDGLVRRKRGDFIGHTSAISSMTGSKMKLEPAKCQGTRLEYRLTSPFGLDPVVLSCFKFDTFSHRFCTRCDDFAVLVVVKHGGNLGSCARTRPLTGKADSVSAVLICITQSSIRIHAMYSRNVSWIQYAAHLSVSLMISRSADHLPVGCPAKRRPNVECDNQLTPCALVNRSG